MVLLGINAGFGNTDVATLPQSAVDLENGWVDFPRQKTEINRLCPLWQQTVEAINDALESKPKARSEAGERVCFLTPHGNLWVRTKPSDKNFDAVTVLDTLSQSFRQILNDLGITGHRNFYALRHTFETIGGESKDQVAVNEIMGHTDSSMAATYRERISDERLKAVVDVVTDLDITKSQSSRWQMSGFEATRILPAHIVDNYTDERFQARRTKSRKTGIIRA
jgi:site-specific recombinase XerD